MVEANLIQAFSRNASLFIYFNFKVMNEIHAEISASTDHIHKRRFRTEFRCRSSFVAALLEKHAVFGTINL